MNFPSIELYLEKMWIDLLKSVSVEEEETKSNSPTKTTPENKESGQRWRRKEKKTMQRKTKEILITIPFYLTGKKKNQ